MLMQRAEYADPLLTNGDSILCTAVRTTIRRYHVDHYTRIVRLGAVGTIQ